MFETEVNVNKFLLNYVSGLIKDIPEERLAEQPAPGINHPAWILGHLAYTGDSATALLGGERILTNDWVRQYGPNSSLTTERSDYPATAELLDLLMSRFNMAHSLAKEANAIAMAAPNPRTQMIDRLPTVGDLVSFVFTGHMGVHLGQLSAWRRVIGIGRLF